MSSPVAVQGGLTEGLASTKKHGNAGEAGKRRRIMPESLEARPGEQVVELSPQQERVVRLVVDRARNVFFTGGAGTGKSETVKAIVRQAAAKRKTTFVTALTGILGSK